MMGDCASQQRSDSVESLLPGAYGMFAGHGQALGEVLLYNGGDNTHVTRATVDSGQVLPCMAYKTGYIRC